MFISVIQDKPMSRVNFLICTAVAVICISFWALLNRPEQEPPWPSRIQGFSFSPFQQGQSAIEGTMPSEEQVDSDLALLADKTNAIRTYTVQGVQARIPAMARKHKLNVTLGAWISADLERNEAEIEKVIQLTRENWRNVVRVVVGNESLLREEVTSEQLVEYIDRVRAGIREAGSRVPVSTAEPWHVWIKHSELGEHVDFIATHMLPYWEGIQMEMAVGYIIERVNLLKETFPSKPVVITEVGWPSNGRTRKAAVASPANQATFLRRFIARAEQEKYIYYVMEAFDQPWKSVTEGAVGAYWGIFDVKRQPKFPLTSPIVEIPEWRALAAISVVIAIITFALLLIDSQTLQKRGRGFLGLIAFSAATAGVWIVYSYTRQYMTVTTVLVGLLMVIGMIGVVVVLLTEAHEWAEASWADRRRPFSPVTVSDKDLPMVSVHVPAYNEPPEMLMETLNALSNLDYPFFEVIVIDNNTQDPLVWQPIEAHCAKLGYRFRFFHVNPLPGFKAGALNFALARTAPDVDVIAVIDSDYVVEPNWLRDLASQFVKPSVAIVQAPQDYRDDGENMFKAMCYAEYRGFFYIGMLTRNERNAIIQHGTMTMVRKSVLEEVEGWAEWCITEDAELGLKTFEKGYEAAYTASSYGKGLMPDTFIDFKKQRFRWAYGAMQILRRHATRLLLPGQSNLTYGQRYHFVAGWLPWMADGINLLFTMSALLWSLAMCLLPLKFDPPLVILSVMPMSLFIFKVAKMIYLYRRKVGANIAQTLASALAGLSLSHTISKAILLGIFTKSIPFFRTPKLARAHALFHALQSAREEGLLAGALWLAAFTVAARQGSDTPDVFMWLMVLLVQSIPYSATVAMAIISGFSRVPSQLIQQITASPAAASETDITAKAADKNSTAF
jgi:exo-beta-1,3-glucanase (GH17 family)/cellulose synthase/poly-beta-1,6-N-acetylglucosamine synthase-like glycosyltransferase